MSRALGSGRWMIRRETKTQKRTARPPADQYRLCPLDEGELTEECFKRTPLPFGSHEQVVRFKDREERFNGTFVSEGVTPPGHEWAMNPIPMCGTPTTHTSDPSGNVHTCPGGTPRWKLPDTT